MTSKEQPSGYEPPTNFIQPVLEDSQYTQGMQNKKLERQAVKGLTPKYCYAALSANQTISAWWSAIINFNTFSTNDNRMNTTNNRIIVPQSWLWVIMTSVSIQSLTSSEIWWFELKRNWNVNFTPTLSVISEFYDSEQWVTCSES